MLNSVCLICKKEFHRRPSLIKKGYNKYCSLQCTGIAKINKEEFTCQTCQKVSWRQKGKLKNNKTNNFYCSHKCAAISNNKLFPLRYLKKKGYKNGRSVYRKRAIEAYGLLCQSRDKCPLKNIQLPDFLFEVDHIDGDHNNNDIKNLQVLCVWCHKAKTFNREISIGAIRQPSKLESSVQF